MTLTEWLNEMEGVNPRKLRLLEDIDSGEHTAIMRWIRTAWDLGAAAEREACAALAADRNGLIGAAIAAAIRARGKGE